jgi:hypothetical protein
MKRDIIVPQVEWTEVYGNPFSKGIAYPMLSESGYVYATHTRLLGNPGYKQFCQVRYDRKYVLAYLANKIIKPLRPLDRDGIKSLIEAAIDFYLQSSSIGEFIAVDESGNWTVSNGDSKDDGNNADSKTK